MQRCPLAGYECGSMVEAKPWEASEQARQLCLRVRGSLSGHSPVSVGPAAPPAPLPLSGKSESE